MQTAYFRFLLISIFGIFLSPMAPYLPLQASSVRHTCTCIDCPPKLTENDEWPFSQDGSPSTPEMDDLLFSHSPYIDKDEDMSVEAMASTDIRSEGHQEASFLYYKETPACDAKEFENFCEALPSILALKDDPEQLLIALKASLMQSQRLFIKIKNSTNTDTPDNLAKIKFNLKNVIIKTLSYCRFIQSSLWHIPLTELQKGALRRSYNYTSSLINIFKHYYPSVDA